MRAQGLDDSGRVVGFDDGLGAFISVAGHDFFKCEGQFLIHVQGVSQMPAGGKGAQAFLDMLPRAVGLVVSMKDSLAGLFWDD